ncbi:AcrR family transcriptional regulator [Nocardioides thalensis]|uniref:AcrR family transcriptional regulator n=1 Tax=Nocardioides thalensis TaxID=1914755 RepID=A0A853C7R6_9ACTN|nr:TetR/AcrR family transcriptional regulator [Nocardioides thalensis]NYJ03191.1 AcrR family transcriptional regulator [Nocardioides thalensis]
MPAGRPRSFDAEEKLDVAMRLFWRDGYEGVSLSDLTEAMGINRRSLYAAYGNKETLFASAARRYLDGPGAFVSRALEEPTARGVAAVMLHGCADAYTQPDSPAGCLLVQSALACSPEDDGVRRLLARYREDGVLALAARFERARNDGDLGADETADPKALARMLTAIGQGMSVQAAGGASREQLHELADQALKAWPTP